MLQAGHARPLPRGCHRLPRRGQDPSLRAIVHGCFVGSGLDRSEGRPGKSHFRDAARWGQDPTLRCKRQTGVFLFSKQNARPPLPGGRAECANVAYSAWIAPVGQTPSQAPQSTQEAASTTALSSMVIAPTGQVSTHAPQATHSLETV